ncbi:HNH endonuclease [Marinobacter subterrani]|uniref:HNH endonuclease n=1 Tax=Marinobacter subterrani TaxID=1658765 RepID=A0A0J7JAT6_9GAMM|nr:HNH endonuclease signature motif containing protein [Marinobacter subterrani]KMQ75282.1 HNH endonuclease [Marinobacter subterrani]
MSIIELMARPIAFQRAFVDLGVGIAGALMLSQCIYWAKRVTDEDGWFYKSQQDWEEETGMNRREQERARKALKSIGVLEEKRRGVPAKMYFRVNEQALEKALLGSPQALELEDALETYRSTLNGLSKTGLMRAKKLGAKAEYVDYSAVLKRDGMVCGCCQKPIVYGPGQHGKALCFDHKKPLAEGGDHTEDNIQPAHVACNVRKGGTSQSSMSTQDKLSMSRVEQPSMSTVDKQECLPKANKSALIEQTITEITTETTPEITAERTSGPDRPDDSSPPSGETNPEPDPEPNRPDAAIQNGRFWGNQDDLDLAVWMWDRLAEQLGQDKPRQPNFSRWANTIRLMREQDNRDPRHIRVLYNWCRQHDFWAANIQSPDKLRDKWSQLVLQRKTERRKPAAESRDDRNAALQRIHEQRNSGQSGVTYEHQ